VLGENYPHTFFLILSCFYDGLILGLGIPDAIIEVGKAGEVVYAFPLR